MITNLRMMGGFPWLRLRSSHIVIVAIFFTVKIPDRIRVKRPARLVQARKVFGVSQSSVRERIHFDKMRKKDKIKWK